LWSFQLAPPMDMCSSVCSRCLLAIVWLQVLCSAVYGSAVHGPLPLKVDMCNL
jgi:hypothetical protein